MKESGVAETPEDPEKIGEPITKASQSETRCSRASNHRVVYERACVYWGRIRGLPPRQVACGAQISTIDSAAWCHQSRLYQLSKRLAEDGSRLPC
jgi:hypothetical protein